MLKCILAILIMPLTYQHLLGQQYNLIRKIPIESPRNVTSDPLGHIYIQTAKGDLVKMNLNGEELLRNSLASTKKITTLQAGPSLALFAFYEASQQFQFFDRNLNPSALYNLSDQDQSFFSLATPASDNSLWLWDASHLALKKYKPALQEYLISTNAQFYLSEGHDIRQLQEYQNRVYVNDRNHDVMVFDPLGNYIQKLPVPPIERFAFYHDELYWMADQTVYFYHVYQMRKRQMNLPGSESALFVLLQEDRLFIFSKNELLIYRILQN